MIKIKNVFFALLCFFVPTVTFAHVRWFAEEEVHVKMYSITDPKVLIGVFFFLIVVLLGIYLEKKLKVPARLDNFIEKLAPYVLSIASIGFGLALLLFSYNGFVFAPNLQILDNMGRWMIFVQALAGFMILFGIYERLAGLIVIVLFGLVFVEFGFIEMIDTLSMVGFAIYIMIIGRPKWKIVETNIFESISHRLHNYGYPALRLFTGLNLLLLGFTEKIFAPSLTQNFLQHYNWNFMQNMGLGFFTDYYFAFYAGLAEILFGVFFILGLITRTTTIFLSLFLVTTLYLLGPVELVGHLPHFSMAIVTLVLGSGTRFVLERKN